MSSFFFLLNLFFCQQYEDLKKLDEKYATIHRLETENAALASSAMDLSVKLTLVEQHMIETNVVFLNIAQKI